MLNSAIKSKHDSQSLAWLLQTITNNSMKAANGSPSLNECDKQKQHSAVLDSIID